MLHPLLFAVKIYYDSTCSCCLSSPCQRSLFLSSLFSCTLPSDSDQRSVHRDSRGWWRVVLCSVDPRVGTASRSINSTRPIPVAALFTLAERNEMKEKARGWRHAAETVESKGGRSKRGKVTFSLAHPFRFRFGFSFIGVGEGYNRTASFLPAFSSHYNVGCANMLIYYKEEREEKLGPSQNCHMG